jgi:hypothetical protein
VSKKLKIFIAVFATLIGSLGLATAVASPASASAFTTCGDLFSSGDQSYYPWASGGTIGEARVCLDSTPGSVSYNCFSQATFYAQSGNPNCDSDRLVVDLWDWTDNPGSDYIYLEYQGWTDHQWHTARIDSTGATVADYYGGPVTIETWFTFAINLDPAGLRFLRIHDSYTGAFSYIFKSTGAGGCGYKGIPPCPSNAY